MKQKGMKALAVRNALAVILVVLVFLISLGFSYGLSLVKSSGVLVSQKVADATASNQLADSLQRAKEQLAQGRSLIDKANTLFTTEANYQTQLSSDIREYANRYGLNATDYDFRALDNGGSATQPRYSIAITLASPVRYESLIHFIGALEGNIPKIQVLSLHIETQGATDMVAVKALTVGVFTR